MYGSGGINKGFDMEHRKVCNTQYYRDFHNCLVECKVRKPNTIYEISRIPFPNDDDDEGRKE